MRKTLITTNIITGILLAGLLIFNNYPQRIYKRTKPFFTQEKTQSRPLYSDNKYYKEAIDYYNVYTGNKNIVMLGNSFTEQITWTELLGRDDIANRGIGADITEGFLNRLKYVLNLKPQICFIEGGVNDLVLNISKDTIIKNLNAIIDTLLNNKITPVLTTVSYVKKTYSNAEKLNRETKELNKKIIKLSETKKIYLIDLNPLITDGDYLLSEYSAEDGIHFTGKTYLIWKDKILKILEQEKI